MAERHILVIKKVKYVDLFSASSRSASNALPLPASRRYLRKPTLQPSIQRTLRDHVIWAGVSSGMPVYSPSFCQVLIPAWAGSGWADLGAWFRAEVVYPSKDGCPPRH